MRNAVKLEMLIRNLDGCKTLSGSKNIDLNNRETILKSSYLNVGFAATQLIKELKSKD